MNNIDDENVDEFTKIAFICVNDTSGEYYHDPLFNGLHHNVLNLFFDDVENDLELSPTNSGKTRAFTKEDAKRVITFLDSNKHIESLLIHCAAGISRSGAVGQFALDYLKGDKEYFRINNSQILPNAKVLQLLNAEYGFRNSKTQRFN
jgi:predicted protein tyrosine phosphatase